MVEARVGRLKVLGRRQAGLRRPQCLVAGGRPLAALDPGQVPHDPVGGLDEPARRVVDLAVLEPQLDQLWEIPLGGDPTPVAPDEALLPLQANIGQAVGYGLRRVVLPELGPGMRMRAPALELA